LPPVHMIREIGPYVWLHPTLIDEPRLTVSLPLTLFDCRIRPLRKTAIGSGGFRSGAFAANGFRGGGFRHGFRHRGRGFAFGAFALGLGYPYAYYGDYDYPYYDYAYDDSYYGDGGCYVVQLAAEFFQDQSPKQLRLGVRL
jgi:hypothetical protein